MVLAVTRYRITISQLRLKVRCVSGGQSLGAMILAALDVPSLPARSVVCADNTRGA